MSDRLSKWLVARLAPLPLWLLRVMVVALIVVLAGFTFGVGVFDWWLAHVWPWWLFGLAVVVVWAAQTAWKTRKKWR